MTAPALLGRAMARLSSPARRRVGRAANRLAAVRRRRTRPRWGNLRRFVPLSDRYGFDRGTPIDRVYLDRFFGSHAADIRGRVLEVKDPHVTTRFGRDVTAVDLLDIDPDNEQATLVADLAEAGSLPASRWDCIVIPQTLQYVEDPAAAIANAWHALRPGGVLLLTAPALARVDPDIGDIDRWRFLPVGLLSLLRRSCPGGDVDVTAYGNLVTSLAFLLGLAAEELADDELDRSDSAHPVLVAGRATRPVEA
jgi:SAM-dependent methyltransferase